MAKKQEIRKRVQKQFTLKSETQQHHYESTKVDNILKKYAHTGDSTLLNKRPKEYKDLTQVPDLQTALNKVRLAEQQFNSLSSQVRERFGNNPTKLFTFLENKNNRDEAIKLGLIQEKAEKYKQDSPIVQQSGVSSTQVGTEQQKDNAAQKK